MDQKRALRQLLELQKRGRDMRLAAEEWKSDWQTLIAILLSARTRDEVTIEVCTRLFARYPNAEALAGAPLTEVEALIRRVNFYRNKARNILACSQALNKSYAGRVPHDLNALVELPGVGRKTANVFLSEYNHDAIGVDTHLAYCSRNLEWTKNTDPYKIETDLMNLFPKKYWSSLNEILVRFGKTYISRKRKDELLEQIKKIK